MASISDPGAWPALPYQGYEDACATLHMCSQIVGKIRMALAPPVNHFWHVPLYLTTRGLTTSPIPYGAGSFAIDFDFIDHQVVVQTSDGACRTVPLVSRPVAEFYEELFGTLKVLGIEVEIWDMPVEVPEPIRFTQDRRHSTYDPDYAFRLWRVLALSEAVLQEFRGRFIGKCSPVHYFWGSPDLAVSRFSGRLAPEKPDADPITREAYSHEVISHGFWPGNATALTPALGQPAFYSYTSPAPEGLRNAPVRPGAAFWSDEYGEFLLSYEEVRQSGDPRQALLEFCQSTYEAGANLAGWDRAALERGP